ncbi:MAG: hypothetical protein LBI86_05045 [Treponema sp.]|jgi:hypothetical protein|nr:hypothetical protein [Treponema sp.]
MNTLRRFLYCKKFFTPPPHHALSSFNFSVTGCCVLIAALAFTACSNPAGGNLGGGFGGGGGGGGGGNGNNGVNAASPVITSADPPLRATFYVVDDVTVAQLSVSAAAPTDGGTLAYQWCQSSDGVTWTPIAGPEATNNTYTPPADSALGDTVRYYRAEITNTIPNNGDGGTKSVTVTSGASKVTVLDVASVSDVAFVFSGSPYFGVNQPFDSGNWTVKLNSGAKDITSLVGPEDFTCDFSSSGTNVAVGIDISGVSSNTETVTVIENLVLGFAAPYFGTGAALSGWTLMADSADVSGAVTVADFSGYDNTTPGAKSVSVTLGSVTSNAVNVRVISILTLGFDMPYFGTGAALSGWTLSADGDDISELVNAAAFSGYDSSSTGAKSVTITLGGKTSNAASVTVFSALVLSISPASFSTGAPLSGWTLMADSADISALVSAADFTYDFSSAGTKSVSITLRGKTSNTVNVTVIGTLSLSLSFGSPYFGLGEPLSGWTLMNGAADISASVNAGNFSGYDSSTAGTQTVSVTVYGNTLQANVTVQTLAQRIAAAPAAATTITLYADEPFTAVSAANIPAGKAMTLAGSGAERTITLTGTGNMFYVGGSLTLDNNVTLKGHDSNITSLVGVEGSGSSLVMKTGAKITGNRGAFTGGVDVSDSGSFTMEGGTISGNTGVSSGGGVTVYVGSFTMKDGTISGNTATGTYGGGGVLVLAGNFTMEDGTISGNTATTATISGGGGGVDVANGASFIMSGGAISGNTASGTMTSSGGGVSVRNGGSFIMSGSAVISGNTATGGGGVGNGGSFTMEGGAISGNTASTGGGVYLAGAYWSGDACSFSKTGGIIYGNTGDVNANVAKDSGTATPVDTEGHAVFYGYMDEDSILTFYYRDTTLNPGDNISTDTLPSSGTGYNWTKK